MTTTAAAEATSGVDQEPLPVVANQQQEPELKGEGSTAEDDAFEVRVKLTVAIPYRGRRGLMDALDSVLTSLRQEGPLPEGSYLRGGIDITTRTAKEMRADAKRADAKKRRGA